MFGRDNHSGNRTGVVLDECTEPAALAGMLGFPDTAFVQEHTGHYAAVRTFSPYEELAQCLQTTLATPVALGAADGEAWQVQHPAGALDVQVERVAEGWISWTVDTDTTGEPEPIDDLPDWLHAAEVCRVPQARSRLYVRLPNVSTLPTFDAADVRWVCHTHDCTAVVFFAEAADKSVRMRVFTMSLAGGEDIATGGAAAGVGALLAHRRRTGRINVIQGPDKPVTQGHLLLVLGPKRHVGGRVLESTQKTTTC